MKPEKCSILRMISGMALGLSLVCLPLGWAGADLIVDGPTTDWTAVSYFNNTPDPFTDQQTGSLEAELVGDAIHPSFYMQFDDAGTPSLEDGTIAFRVRLAEAENPPGFSTALFVGLDADLDGTLDLFLGVHNSGSNDEIAIWDPGTGANTSPSTTSIESPPIESFSLVIAPSPNANYDWAPVTALNDPDALSYNVDNGTTQGGNDPGDYFLSFSLPFSNVVSRLANLTVPILFDQTTPITLVMGTATQDNSLNQDLNGISGSINSTNTWAQLGIQSEILSVDGSVVPEPTSLALLLTVFPLGLACRRRRSGSPVRPRTRARPATGYQSRPT